MLSLTPWLLLSFLRTNLFPSPQDTPGWPAVLSLLSTNPLHPPSPSPSDRAFLLASSFLSFRPEYHRLSSLRFSATFLLRHSSTIVFLLNLVSSQKQLPQSETSTLCL